MVLPARIFACCCLPLFLICLCGAAPAQRPPARRGGQTPNSGPQRHGRDVVVIDGTWKFRTDPDDAGKANQWMQSVPNGASDIAVPSLWTTQAAPGYTGVAWYWRQFDVPAAWQGQTVRLRFEGAAETAEVWINGAQLGEHVGGVTPFEFNATKAIHANSQNLVAVRLVGNGKWGAGLWQGVELLAHDEAYIADCFPQGDLFGHLTAALTFQNNSNNSGDATLDARIAITTAPARDVRKTSEVLHLTPGKNETNLLLSVPTRQVRLWSPESPTLYLLQLAFRQDKDVLDTQETSFGFRTLGLQNGSLTINGTATKLTAIAPEFDHPVVFATTEDEQRVRDLLRKLKSQGVTLIYLEAPPTGLLRLADQEGMLVVESARHGEQAAAQNSELKALIARDRAHPCVIAWKSDELAEEEAQALRKLDSTRFLLASAGSAPRLWLPDQDAPSTEPLPSGLLPPHQ